MKKCDYCGKEISYNDMYCSEDCQIKTVKFYSIKEKFSMVFSVINCICLFLVPIGFIVFSFMDYLGFSIIAIGTAVLGLTVLLLPLPTDGMISKFKVKKAVDITRIIGLIILILGIGLIITDYVIYFI